MKTIKYTLAVLTLPILIMTGCEDRYRYACQDPKNWDSPQCQKPYCDIHKSCPDMIFAEESSAVIPTFTTDANCAQ
jgi:hypothetical protein